MSTAELKLDLIDKITKLKEVRIIEEVQKLLDFETDKGIFHLSEAQRSRIRAAQKDELIPEEKADLEIEEWLREK